MLATMIAARTVLGLLRSAMLDPRYGRISHFAHDALCTARRWG
jgi:hypothetical protein